METYRFEIDMRCPNGTCDEWLVMHEGGPKIVMGTGEVIHHPWVCREG